MLLIAALSGAAALIYEIVWLRLLTLAMGHTTAAVGIVLAAFMGGLAAGAWAGGRRAVAASPARACRAYAGLELAIAGCALALPFLWTALRPILAWAYADGSGGVTFDLVRVALALGLLAIPAAAMGATYPFAIRGLSTRPTRAGADASGGAGAVYAANTAGAAAGVLLGGFVLLPLLGMRGTTLAAVLLNVAAAALAVRLARRADDVAPPAPAPPARLPVGPRLWLAAAALGVSGFVALVYEVVWTRLLAMVLGPTTYAFSAMLLAFIAGIGLGAAAAAVLVPRTRHPGRWLGAVLLAAAGVALAASTVVDRLPLLMAAAVISPETTFGSVFRLQLALGIALQLPLTIALGAAFPFAVAHAAPGLRDAPRAASVIYAVNTAGAIGGALAGSFLLIPRLGLQSTLRLAAMVTIVIGVIVCWRTSQRRAARFALAAAGIAAIALTVWLPAWNVERLANGGYRYAPGLAAAGLATGLEAGRLLYYREGAAGTVSVRELPGARSLAIDGKVDASNREDMLTQKLLAHLPLLLHGRARDVLVIGLGSGVTLGAALQHPIDRADVLEISPEVVAASALFAKENRQALADPRARLVVGDGRSHLLLARRRYDVIISEPSNPWMAGVAALFTREFFAAARARLAPGGILCQWTHTYSISGDDLRSIVATFLAEFPQGSAWLVGDSDLLLIGATAPLPPLDPDAGGPEVAEDLRGVDVRDAFSLTSLFVAAGADLRRYAAGARIQDDDRMALEFTAPRSIYGQFQQENVARLLALRPAAVVATAEQRRNRGLMLLGTGAAGMAYDDLAAAVAGGVAADPEALDGLRRAAVAAGRDGDAAEALRAAAAATASAQPLVVLSQLLAARGAGADAIDVAREAALREPGNSAALDQLASAYADAGDAAALEQLVRIVDPAPAHRRVAWYARARLSSLRGELDQAGIAAEQLVAIERSARSLSLLGTIRAAQGEDGLAREAFEASLAMAPRDAAVLASLGRLALRAGDPALAADRFTDAAFLDPRAAPARGGGD